MSKDKRTPEAHAREKAEKLMGFLCGCNHCKGTPDVSTLAAALFAARREGRVEAFGEARKIVGDQSEVYFHNRKGCDEPYFSQYDFAIAVCDVIASFIRTKEIEK